MFHTTAPKSIMKVGTGPRQLRHKPTDLKVTKIKVGHRALKPLNKYDPLSISSDIRYSKLNSPKRRTTFNASTHTDSFKSIASSSPAPPSTPVREWRQRTNINPKMPITPESKLPRSPTSAGTNRPRTASPKKPRTTVVPVVPIEESESKSRKPKPGSDTSNIKPEATPQSEPVVKPVKKAKLEVAPKKKNPLKVVKKLDPVNEEEPPGKKRKNKEKKKNVGDTGPVSVHGKPLRRSADRSPPKKELANFPLLEDEELVKRFMSVTMTNNQKGRIRQALRDMYKGTDPALLPDVIHNKMQSIIKGNTSLNDAELRKIRVLYNMLKLATEIEFQEKCSKKKSEQREPTRDVGVGEEAVEKKKKSKRYILFLGNLPLEVTETMIIHHFHDVQNYIKSVRIPQKENKKSAIAYVEMANQPSYELALSKHHSVMGSKRINVLYTTTKKSKTTPEEAKAKRAKLTALVKSGMLPGSMTANTKRNLRRAKMRKALKAQE